MNFLKRGTKAPVPCVFSWELDESNPVGSAFVLMELLPGNIASDAARSYERVDWGRVPLQHRPVFYRSLAEAHVQIASARLPQIGTVRREDDGSFGVGTIPGIGGPEDYLAQVLPPSALDEILQGNKEFPVKLAALASTGKYFTQKGPFPIRHDDLYHSNVIVDKTYHVLGVIDWEGAYAVPWELIDLPCFLATVPRLLNPTEQYDAAGRPLDPDEIGQWADEEAYVEMVRDAEREANVDGRLSKCSATGMRKM